MRKDIQQKATAIGLKVTKSRKTSTNQEYQKSLFIFSSVYWYNVYSSTQARKN